MKIKTILSITSMLAIHVLALTHVRAQSAQGSQVQELAATKPAIAKGAVGAVGAVSPSTSDLAGVTTLTFDKPQTAGISGFRAMWDAPVVLEDAATELGEGGAVEVVDKAQFGKGPSAVWDPAKRDNGKKPGALVFDAVHRSLLVRFPGAAESIAKKLSEGNSIAKVELVLPFRDTELWPEGYAEPDGMTFLGDTWVKTPPSWHAVAWLLRRPWQADASTGPTFNAFINGAGYWAKYGAQDEAKDRFPQQFGPAEVSVKNPEGRLDVTDAFTKPEYGKSLSERLRIVESDGFLVRKWEVYDASYWSGGYEWATATGPRGILIKTPSLVVSFKPDAKAKQIKPQSVQVEPVSEIATRLQKEKSGGVPTAVMPSAEEIQALSQKLSKRERSDIPEWQRKRLQTMLGYGGAKLFPDTPETYAKWVDAQLARAPRSWRGFDAGEVVENCLLNEEAMPAPVKDHWKLYWWSWLMPDRDFLKGFEFNGKKYQFAHGYIGAKEAKAYYDETKDWRGNFSVYRTYCYAMGTMNFNNWCSIGTLGGGILLENPMLINDGRNGVEKWCFKTWSWGDGTTQESIDHYYFAESLTAQKVIQDTARSPFERMIGESIIAKSVEELASAYHPNLRRFIATSGRTGIAYLLGIQDGTMHVMDSLSEKGALTDVPAGAVDLKAMPSITATNVEKMPVFGHNLYPGRVAQQAIISPWAPEWMSKIVDDKPLPYYSINSFKMWGQHAAHPLWKCSYLGKNYGLATLDVATGINQVPFMAQWRRADEPTVSMTQLGTVIARAGINRTELLDSIYHDITSRNPNGIVGMQGSDQFALQNRNKAIVLTSPTDHLKNSEGGRPLPDKITSLQTTLGFFNFEATPSWEWYLDGERIEKFPVRAKLGQRITVKDGVSYMAIIPVQATDLGRDIEVEIVDDGKMTEMQGGGNAREALRMNIYNMRKDAPIDPATADWAAIDRAINGFVFEAGDKDEYGSFEKFQKHIAESTLSSTWDAAKDQAGFTYKSGDDLLECSFKPTYAQGPSPGAFPMRQVNGKWPYNQPDIQRDTTLTQMGESGKLEKNGATLLSAPRSMAYLLADPAHGLFSAYQPYSKPTFQSLSLPGDIRVEADGRLPISRVSIQQSSHKIEVSYANKAGNSKEPGMASHLLFFGLKDVKEAELNGKKTALKAVRIGDQEALALPLEPDGAAISELPERYAQAHAAFEKLLAENGKIPQSIQDWMFVGPFANDNGAGFDAEYPPEQGKVDLNAAYTGAGNKEVKWMRSQDKGKPALGDAAIDFMKIFTPNESVCAYAYTTVSSDQERKVYLAMGSDDTITAWINGKKIWANNCTRGVVRDSDVVECTLHKGENEILVKICQGGSGWGFVLRITDEFGLPVEGITYNPEF